MAADAAPDPPDRPAEALWYEFESFCWEGANADRFGSRGGLWLPSCPWYGLLDWQRDLARRLAAAALAASGQPGRGRATMTVVDPGHVYLLDALDGEQVNRLVFVKREGPGYPGNVGSHPGTTMQEVLRALIERANYVQGQLPCAETAFVIDHLTAAIVMLEVRAARRHGRVLRATAAEVVAGVGKCPTCGHVGCPGDCHAGPQGR
jgi:hypothetical protein